MRIQPHATHRTEALLDSARTLDRAAKLAKKGLVVLRVADLSLTGTRIATASSDQERTAIVLDTIAENAGTAAGIALAILAFGNPVGLTGLAIVAVAGAAGGTIGQIIGNRIEQNVLYDTNGQRLETKADLAWRFFRYRLRVPATAGRHCSRELQRLAATNRTRRVRVSRGVRSRERRSRTDRQQNQ